MQKATQQMKEKQLMKNEVKIKQTMELATVADILKDLVKSFDEGTVCFEKGKEFVTLKPGKMIEVEIEAGLKKDRQKLSVELSWRQFEPEKEDSPVIKISSQEPEMEAPAAEESASDTEGSETESTY
jgi:amphi-Trp domain-containing protein